jgi:meckelin
MHFVFILTSRLATSFYLLILATSTYWLLFYKAQSRLYLFLPSSTFDLFNFNIVFTTSFIAQTLYIGYLIYKQCTVDMFYIDWEKNQSESSMKQYDSTDTIDAKDENTKQVSIWRTFFVANQWNNLVVRFVFSYLSSRIVEQMCHLL